MGSLPKRNKRRSGEWDMVVHALDLDADRCSRGDVERFLLGVDPYEQKGGGLVQLRVKEGFLPGEKTASSQWGEKKISIFQGQLKIWVVRGRFYSIKRWRKSNGPVMAPTMRGEAHAW